MLSRASDKKREWADNRVIKRIVAPVEDRVSLDSYGKAKGEVCQNGGGNL